MFATESAGEIGNVLVHKVDFRGFNPEELADQALNTKCTNDKQILAHISYTMRRLCKLRVKQHKTLNLN